MEGLPTVIGLGTFGLDADGERIDPGLSSESRVRKSKAERPGSEHHGPDLSHNPAAGSSLLAAGWRSTARGDRRPDRDRGMAGNGGDRHTAGMLQRVTKLMLPMLAAGLSWPALAEDAGTAQSPEDERPVWTLTFENDLTNNTDRYFTNGIRLNRTSPVGAVPEAVVDAARPLIGTIGTVRWTVGIGQNMYTPSDITVSDPDPDDQPYAGWLYGTVGVLNDLATGDGNRTQTSVQLSLGVVGPSALGEEAQKFVHEIVNSPEPQGWDHQLHDEPAVLLNLERRWVVPSEPVVGDLRGDVSPHVGLALGNVFTHAAAGFTLRFGEPPQYDYGPPRLQPHTPGSEYFAARAPDDEFGWYLFAGAEGRAVARNIFLDGNTFRDSPSVDKELLVADLSAGVVMTFGDMRVSYVQVLRTKEFEGQEGPSLFGAFSVGYRF